jgi:putative tricarboxylic transport membrane protein
MKINNGKDFWAGLMFIGFGLGFMFVSRNYPMGSALRMGPAYFPTVLGGLMAVLGAIVLFRSFFSKIENPLNVFPFRPWMLVAALVLCVPLYYWNDWFKGAPDIMRMAVGAVTLGCFLGAWGPKSLFLVLLSVAAFGYLLRPLGLVVATIVLVIGSAYAGHEFKLKEQSILAVGLAIFVVWTFVHGLGLSMNVWPGFLE